jgi:hypothetical protein
MCSSEPVQVSSIRQQLMVARASLLNLQEVVAKHNEAIRTRYPPSDALYKSFERAMMGVFNDIPLPVHAFAHAAENLAYDCKDLPMHPADLFSEGVIDILDRARSWAGAPQRNSRGQWKKSLSHIEAHLAGEIGVKADVFFRDVYALPGVDAKTLKNEEKAFLTRYDKLLAAHARAKLDSRAKGDVRVALGKSLPDTICWSIVAYVQ